MSFEKFLAISFMCHQRSDRSFYIKGKKLPLCARCTGMLIGYFLGIITAIILECNYYIQLTMLIIPMIIDGIVQQWFGIESNNVRRLVTGMLGGIAIINAFIGIHMFTLWWLGLLLNKTHI